MAKRCLIETCKREAETYCYHCSQDVCTKHYLDHKKSIQEQLNPIVDEINLIYDRLRHTDQIETKPIPQYVTNTCNQLDKWREDFHHRIDITYYRIRDQIQNIIENHKREQTEKVMKSFESLGKMRTQMNELLKEGDVTHRQLESIKQQVEEIKRKEQEPIKYPNISISIEKLNIDKCISITIDEKQRQSKPVQRTPSNKYKYSLLLY